MASSNLRNQMIAAAVISSTTVIRAIPETIAINKYKEFHQFYDGKNPLLLDSDTYELVEQTLYKVDLDPHLESRLEIFVNYGQNALHKGSVHMRSGAIIGLPIYFRYKNLSDIHTSHLRVANKAIDWSSEIGQKFSNSLILSDKAKKFAIAREIFYIADHNVMTNSCLLMFNLSAAYCAYYAVNSLYRLKQKMHLFGRVFVAGSFYAMALGSFLFMHDLYERRRDWKVDNKVAKLGKDYNEGGIEFYNLLLQRNTALYHLLGEDGYKSYTQFGNETVSVRMKSLPITARRDYLKQTFAKTFQSDLQEMS
ncbi:transmembrane protein 177-like [Argonauta hians]